MSDTHEHGVLPQQYSGWAEYATDLAREVASLHARLAEAEKRVEAAEALLRSDRHMLGSALIDSEADLIALRASLEVEKKWRKDSDDRATGLERERDEWKARAEKAENGLADDEARALIVNWKGMYAAAIAERDAAIARAERNQREHDLVRQMRHVLFTENLITQDEYAALATEHGGVQRLEDYDQVRALADTIAAQLGVCREALLLVGDHTNDCGHSRALLRYNKGTGPYPDASDCNCIYGRASASLSSAASERDERLRAEARKEALEEVMDWARRSGNESVVASVLSLVPTRALATQPPVKSDA